MASKQCPICKEGKLGFIAHPTLQNDDVIAVIATCNMCHYPFFHHLDFEQMVSEVVITVEQDDGVEEKRPSKVRQLKLVKPRPV